MTINNFRDALLPYGGPEGVLYRSARLGEEDVPTLNNLLHGYWDRREGQIIDLRTPNRRLEYPTPVVHGVHYVQIALPPTAYVPYREIITDYRPALRAIMAVAASRTPTLIHCTEGKDRTGIVIGLIMLAAGYSLRDARKEYLLSPGADPHLWDSMLLKRKTAREIAGREVTADLLRKYGNTKGK